MLKSRLLGSVICVYLALSTSASPSRAAGCEDTIARHMVGEAMLAAQFVAAAEKNGMTPDAINAALKDIAGKIRDRGVLDHRFVRSCLFDQYLARFHV